jgi:hemolysin III
MKEEKEIRAYLCAQRRDALGLPDYTAGEEIMNAATHGVGAALAVAALIVMLLRAPHTVTDVFCMLLYGATLFLLYIVSTIYHALGVNRGKQVFRVLDHCSIFLLIAGTYTPISLLVIGGRAGWVLFGVMWGMAAFGVFLNAVDMKRFTKVSMVCYIGMGWGVIFTFQDLLRNMGRNEVWLLLLGGVAYTVGAVLYGLGKNMRYMHSLWHLFVLAGSVLHFFSILFTIT